MATSPCDQVAVDAGLLVIESFLIIVINILSVKKIVNVE
jgi:hypothetical protein